MSLQAPSSAHTQGAVNALCSPLLSHLGQKTTSQFIWEFLTPVTLLKGEPEQRVIKEERPRDPRSMPSRVTEGMMALTEKGGVSRGWRKDVLLNLEPHHPLVSLVKTVLGASLEQLDGERAASRSGQWSGQSSCGEAEVRAGHLSTCLCPHPSVLSGDRQSGQPPHAAVECFSVGLEVAGSLYLLRDPAS